MSNTFLKSMHQLQPKPCFKLVNSPLGKTYLQMDDKFKGNLILRLEAAKAFFRSYQNNRHTFSYTIEEVDYIISLARDCNISTDQFFDRIFDLACEGNAQVQKFVLSTFAYLRNELLGTSTATST